MDKIRLATPEEVEKIAQNSDLTSASHVITFGGKDFAVVRNCVEIDPVYFDPSSSSNRKMLFGMNLESILRFQGVQEYYFNVPVQAEAYRHVIETWGATPTSVEPEMRYKKVL